uniref:Transmembrane protein n=1 Tax=Macrostomum lignano TaxID=282301 RepID=A0A1I8JQ44_9PLAT
KPSPKTHDIVASQFLTLFLQLQFFWYLRTVVIRLKSSSLHLVVLTRLSHRAAGRADQFRTVSAGAHLFLPCPCPAAGSESAWSPGASERQLDSLSTLRKHIQPVLSKTRPAALGAQKRSETMLLKFVLAIILPTIIIAKADSVPEPIDKSECYNYIRTNPTACNLQWNYFDGSCRCKRCAPYLAQIMRTRTSGRSIKLSRLKRFRILCISDAVVFYNSDRDIYCCCTVHTRHQLSLQHPKAAHRNRWTFLTVGVFLGMACLATVAFADLAIRCDSVLSLRSKQNLAQTVSDWWTVRSNKDRAEQTCPSAAPFPAKLVPAEPTGPNCPCCWVDDAVHNADGKSSQTQRRHSGIDIVADSECRLWKRCWAQLSHTSAPLLAQ